MSINNQKDPQTAEMRKTLKAYADAASAVIQKFQQQVIDEDDEAMANLYAVIDKAEGAGIHCDRLEANVILFFVDHVNMVLYLRSVTAPKGDVSPETIVKLTPEGKAKELVRGENIHANI